MPFGSSLTSLSLGMQEGYPQQAMPDLGGLLQKIFAEGFTGLSTVVGTAEAQRRTGPAPCPKELLG